MQTPDSNPFADKKLLIGIIVIAAFMVGWQWYLSKRYPNMNKPSVSAAAQTPPAKAHGPGIPGEANPNAPAAESAASSSGIEPQLKTESFFSFEDNKVRFMVSNRGLGLKEFLMKHYKDKDGNPIRLGFSPAGSLFETRLDGNAVDYQVRELESGVYEGTARTAAGVFRQVLRYNKETGAFENTLSISETTPALSGGVTVIVPDTIRTQGSSSWFFPSYDYQDFYIGHSATTESINFNHAKENVRGDYRNVSFVSVGDQYFSSAILDRSSLAPEAVVSADITARTAMAELLYRPTGPAEIKQILYAGPKEINILKRIDPAMASIIDFGALAVIAKPLLWVMKAFYSLVGNWGWAIILLTLAVRFVVLPFNMMSFRSMKAMQKIQPLMTQVRERYKDDPMAQQREMMALMKEHKANPIGGCLPMLLQIPIFFALYRVIGSSVELYQSPFGWWIKDLSIYDPFYVLPVLMGVTMFLQSKLTPTTMDPAQARVMQFLPLVFTVFMLHLPSGLTLYMVVSAVFGIIQQWYVMRDTKVPALASAKK